MITLLILGAAARVIMLLFAPVEPDEEIYSYTAWEVMEGEGVFSSHVPRAPLYFYSVAALYRVLGVSLEVSRLLSVLASTATILAVYLITKRLSDECAALISAGIFSLSPFTLRYSYIALTEPYEWLFLSFSIYFLIVALQDSREGYLAISGLLIVMAAAVRRSALAVPIGMFFFLLLYTVREGLKRTLARLAIYTSSVVIPFGLPLYLAFQGGGGEGLRKFVTFKGAEVGHYQDPWWIGIQLTWFAPVLLLSLAVGSAYLIYRHTPEGRRRDLIGILSLGFPFLLRTAIPWDWKVVETSLILLPSTLLLLFFIKDRAPAWVPPVIISLSALLSSQVFLGTFLKVVIYIFSFTVAMYLLTSYISERHATLMTSILSAALIFLYMRKPEVHLITILSLLPAPAVVSSAILYPTRRGGVWPAIAVAGGSSFLVYLNVGGSPAPPAVILLSLPLLFLPGVAFKKRWGMLVSHIGAYIPLLSLPLLKVNHTVVVLAALFTLLYVLGEMTEESRFYRYLLYSLLLSPWGAFLLHPNLPALSAILFSYFTISFVLLAPPVMDETHAPILLFASLSTLGFYMRYAIMTVYTYEFTSASAVFGGGILRGARGRVLKGVLMMVILSSLLSTAIYSQTPFFERSEPDQHPYLSTVRRVARIIDERTDEGEYILAWHTFAVESGRKTIIEVSNANNYPPGKVMAEMEEKNVSIYVNDFYLNRLLFERDEDFRNYILQNFTLVERVEGIEIYERNQSP